MKGKTSDRIGLGSIFLVACYRVSDPLGVNAYLILSSGLQLELHLSIWQSVDLDVLESATMCRSILPILARRLLRSVLRAQFVTMYFHRFLAFKQPGFDPTFLVVDLSFQQGYIPALLHGLFPIALKGKLGLLILGEYQQT